VIAGSTAAAAVAVHRITGRFWGDLAAIRASASVAAARDGAVYQVVFHRGEAHEFAYPYPPFATLLFQPLARIGMPVAVGAWTLLSVLALAAGVWVALRAAGLAADQRPAVTLVVTLASLPMFAVSGHLQVGQVGLFLMLLVLFDLTAKPHRWWHGLGVGIAAGIKLTPLIFVVYLLVTGRIRAAATATAGFLATVVVGLAWRPADSVWYWGGGFLDPSRVAGDPRTILNQSLRGALARLVDSGDPRLLWLPVAALTGVAGLAVAAWCARAGDHLGGVVAGATTGLLVSPVSWHHHWVWCVPALVLLAGRAWRARSRAGLVAAGGLWLVFVAGTAWVTAGLQGRDLHFRGWGLVYSNLWVLAGLAGLGYLAVRGVRLYASRRRVR
jgi:alpha-1,2-mannosyltransferase